MSILFKHCLFRISYRYFYSDRHYIMLCLLIYFIFSIGLLYVHVRTKKKIHRIYKVLLQRYSDISVLLVVKGGTRDIIVCLSFCRV